MERAAGTSKMSRSDCRRSLVAGYRMGSAVPGQQRSPTAARWRRVIVVVRFRTRLIVFGYPLGEFLLLWLIASVIGWGWALIGILLSIPIGIAVMRNASAGARVVLRESDPERALERVGSECGALLGGAVLPGARLRIGCCRPSAARAVLSVGGPCAE